MSTSPPRTFTVSVPSSDSRYVSSLSSIRSGASAPSSSSATSKRSPKVRHSQRGTIAVSGEASVLAIWVPFVAAGTAPVSPGADML